MAARSAQSWCDGRLGRSMDLAAAATVRARAGAPGECTLKARIWHATLLTRVRGLESATDLLADDTSSTHGSNQVEKRAAYLLCEAEIGLAKGDLDGALASAEAGLRLAQQAGNRALTPSGFLVMAVAMTRRLDLTTALHYANRLRDHALLGHANLMAGQCAWAVAQVLEARDGTESIAHLLKGLVHDGALLRELLVSQPAAAAWLVRAAQRLEDDEIAVRTVTEVSELAVRNPSFRTVQAASAHAIGLFERNASALEKASGLHLDQWAQASALEDASAVRFARRSEQEQAVELLKRAADGYLAVGASRDVLRVRSKLRELEVNSGQFSRRPSRSRMKVSQLTDTEYAVAELVSQGLTNGRVGRQLFMSPHTVAFHLKKIFRKLDVASRVELAGTWNRLVEERTTGLGAESAFVTEAPVGRLAV
ncbi:response regulator transcription factor [Kitasatospora mediocidica]|uniref:response regulator transcription factor n=1 Tax=Kitasatospora mediocidica TaxID=58352 RepID=UPI0012F7335F|nr:LuxR C-terminal-related transcriptional regulator [Kitasatospora mediocidica]